MDECKSSHSLLKGYAPNLHSSTIRNKNKQTTSKANPLTSSAKKYEQILIN